MPITRLAPSPTGALHLGNARTFLVNWLLARQHDWKVILRIEDLDGPRIKKNADQQSIDDLRWLGIDWDEGPIYQSSRMDRYSAAIRKLLETKAAYPCVCSRSEVELAASAPHAEDGSPVYPGTCRGTFTSIEQATNQTGRPPAIRFAINSLPWYSGGGLGRGPTACGLAPIKFIDKFRGPQRFEIERLGDFVIAKADGTPAYQIAVVVDDAEMRITDIVRGDDLLDSTPRQMMLYHALGWGERIPNYYHLPLITGEDGRRLAKRHGDTRLSFYRQLGVRPGRILQLLARWCGINQPTVESASDLLSHFDLDKLPAEPIIFTAGDDAWLKGDGK